MLWIIGLIRYNGIILNDLGRKGKYKYYLHGAHVILRFVYENITRNKKIRYGEAFGIQDHWVGLNQSI